MPFFVTVFSHIVWNFYIPTLNKNEKSCNGECGCIGPNDETTHAPVSFTSDEGFSSKSGIELLP